MVRINIKKKSLPFFLCKSRWFVDALLRTSVCSLNSELCITWRVFNDDGHQRGQTSRPVIGAEIQTNCNFETHVYHCSYHLGLIQRRCFILFHTHIHGLLARPHGAFQINVILQNLQKKVIPDDLTSSREVNNI